MYKPSRLEERERITGSRMPGGIRHKDQGIHSSTRRGIRGLRFEQLDDRLMMAGDSASIRAEMDSLPSEEALVEGITKDEQQIEILRNELSSAEQNSALPIDSPQWNAAGKPDGAIGKLRFDEGRGNALATNPQGTLFLMALASNQVQVLDAQTGGLKLTLGGHGGFITGGAWSPDGSVIATSSNDKIARVFDAVSGRLIASAPMEGKMMSFSHDGKTMAFAKDDGTVLMVEAQTLQIKNSCPAEYPDKVGFTRDDSQVWYTDDTTLKMKDLQTQTVRTISPGIGNIWAMGVSEDDKYVGIGSAQGTTAVLDSVSGKVIAKVDRGGDYVFSLAFAQGKMVVGYWSGKVSMFDLSAVETGKLTALKEYQVGGMAHMLTVTKSGRTVLVQVTYGPKGLDIVALPVPGPQSVGRSVDAVNADIALLMADETRLQGLQELRASLFSELNLALEREEQIALDAAKAVTAASNTAVQAVAQDTEVRAMAAAEPVRYSLNDLEALAGFSGLSNRTVKRMFPVEGTESAFEPEIQVLKTDKAGITVAVSTPLNGGIVMIENGGALAWREVRSSGPVDFATMTLTMDSGSPSGIYELTLRDNAGGTGGTKILKTVNLIRNRETGILSVGGPLNQFIPQAGLVAKDGDDPAELFSLAGEEENRQIALAESATGDFVGVDPVLRSAQLDNPQGKAMVGEQRTRLSALAESANYKLTVTEEELHERFLRVFPKWKDENAQATAKQMNLSLDNFYYYRGAEYDSFRRSLDGYNGAVGKLLEQGIRAVQAGRAGRDPKPFLLEMGKIYGEYGDGKLSQIGFRLPVDILILNAAAGILETQAQSLMQSEIATRLAIEKAELNFNTNPAYAGHGSSSSSYQPAMSAARQAFMANLYAAQAGLAKHDANGNVVGGAAVANSNTDESNLHGAAVDQVSRELCTATNFQWVTNVYDLQTEEEIGTAEDKALYQTIYQQFGDLLTLAQKEYDDVIAVYQNQIDTKSQQLLTNQNLGIIDKTLLTTQIAAAGALKASLVIGKELTPNTPLAAGLDLVFSAIGLESLSKVPIVFRSAVLKFDAIADTKLAEKLIPELELIVANSGKLLAKVQSRIVATGKLILLELPGGHLLLTHVGMTAAQLIQRLADKLGISAASSFLNAATAERVVSKTLAMRKSAINTWAQFAKNKQTIQFLYEGNEILGIGVRRSEGVVKNMYNAIVVLEADGRGGWHLLTSYLQ